LSAVKFCPIVSSGRGSLEPCLEGGCALYAEGAGRCCLWLLVHHLEKLWLEVANLAAAMEER